MKSAWRWQRHRNEGWKQGVKGHKLQDSNGSAHPIRWDSGISEFRDVEIWAFQDVRILRFSGFAALFSFREAKHLRREVGASPLRNV